MRKRLFVSILAAISLILVTCCTYIYVFEGKITLFDHSAKAIGEGIGEVAWPDIPPAIVIGPNASTNNAIPRYDGTSGVLLKDSPDLLFDGTSVTLAGNILARKAVNEIEVFSASDLPSPSGGVITLTDGVYVLKNTITLTDPLKIGAGATVEVSSLGGGIAIIYNGTAPFIQSDATALLFILMSLNIIITGDDVELFDTDGATIAADRLAVVFTGTGGGLGTSINHELIFSIRSSRISGFTEGLTVTGTPLFVLTDIVFESPVLGATPLFSVNGGTTTFNCNSITVDANASDEIFNIDPSFLGFATLNQISNPGGSSFFAAGSLDETNPQVTVSASPPQKSSANIGFVHLNGNATETVINTQGVFEDLALNALAVAGSNIELWTVTNTSTGELTYIGIPPFNGTLLAVMTVISSGGAQEFHFRAVKNGSILSDDVIASREVGVVSGSISLLAPVVAVTGDTIRIETANVDGTSNITIQNLSVQIAN